MASDAGAGDGGSESDGDGGSDAGTVADAGFDAGFDGGLDAGRSRIVEVTGNVIYDPVELSWRCLSAEWRPTQSCINGMPAHAGTVALPDGGTCPQSYPPCLEGDTIEIHDGIRFQAALAALRSEALTYTGRFAVPNVNTVNTTLHLVGVANDPSGALVYSGNSIGRPPFEDNCDSSIPRATGTCTSDKPVYVASKAFVQQLASALHLDFDEMMAQGVVIAHVTDIHTGRGVAGAKIRHVYGAGTPNESQPELTEGVYYINADLTDSVHTDSADDPTAVTSENGLVVRLNAGSTQLFTAAKADGTKFVQHLNGSRPGSVLEIFFQTCAPASEGLLQEGCPRQ